MPGSMTVACRWGQNVMGSSFVAMLTPGAPRPGHLPHLFSSVH